MKSLDRTKKYDLSKLNDEQLQAVLDWLKENDTGWDTTSLEYLKDVLRISYLTYNSEYREWFWSSRKEQSVNAIELFDNDDNSVYDDILSLIEKGKQHGLKIVVTFEKL